jgi:Zn-dependent protease
MDISYELVRHALFSMLGLVLAVTVHEFGHALVADRLGDRTPREQGRLTLSPMAHVDPLGTLVLPLVAVFVPGAPIIGWGKPVQINPQALNRRMPWRLSNLLVSLAGPAMNLVMAAVASVALIGLARAGLMGLEAAKVIIGVTVVLNISLMVFNLLPVPPLDGAAILALVMPRRWQWVLLSIQRWGVLVLMMLFMIGAGRVLMWPARQLTDVWVGALASAMGFVPA